MSRPCARAQLLLRAVPRSEPPPEPAEAEFDLPDEGDDGLLDIDIDIELAEQPALAEQAEAAPVELAAELVEEAAAPEPARAEQASAAAEPPEDLFAVFVAALVRVAMDAGASRIAAGLPGFLERGTLASDGLAPEVVEALVSRGFAEVRDAGLVASAACAATSGAWSHVLRGESDDLSACGTSTLDGWGAELLAASLGAPPDAVKKLRRELRRLGVAAFGIIAQAA